LLIFILDNLGLDILTSNLRMRSSDWC